MGKQLIAARNDLESRFNDMDLMIRILELDENKKIENQLLLKSSLLLMVYNAIEGTMSNLLTELFDSVCEKKLPVDKLPEAFQNLIYKYHLKRIGSKENELKKLYESEKEKICEISYLELSRYLKLFSGNLDAREIRKISENIGIQIVNKESDKFLLIVKNKRNSLAHGEKTFVNASQDITLDEIKKNINSVKNHMEYIIEEYEKFIDKILKSNIKQQ